MMESLSRKKDRIYLTGFMGSGKSTVGSILANTLGYGFVDIDQGIEQAEGKTVSEIFREKGEEYFRNLEQSLLLRVSALPHTVISLGGGTVVEEENYRLIKKTGILVYLKLAPEEIFRRMQRRTDRPLLTDAGGERLPEGELRARIETLYRKREPVYSTADLIIASDETRVGLTVDRIVKALSPLLK